MGVPSDHEPNPMSHTDRKENTVTMKRILTFSLLLELVLVAEAANAATLFTPPLHAAP